MSFYCAGFFSENAYASNLANWRKGYHTRAKQKISNRETWLAMMRLRRESTPASWSLPHRLFNDQSGVTAIEYAVVAGGIGVDKAREVIEFLGRLPLGSAGERKVAQSATEFLSLC
jgi:hypothetical protein